MMLDRPPVPNQPIGALWRCRLPFVSALIGAALASGAALPATAAPYLEFAYAQAPYEIAAKCDPGQPLVVLHIVLRNTGDAPSVPRVIGATEATGVLEGSRIIAPIAPGATVNAQLPLLRVASNAGPVGGNRIITVFLNERQLAPLTVPVPATLCAAQPPPSAPGSRPVRVIGSLQNAGARAAMLARLALPAPSDLHYTTNEATCIAHGGDAISCETLRTSHAVAIYWTSDACGTCSVTGYRLRAPGAPAGAVVDSTKTRIAVEPMPKSGWSGACFVVTSYSEPVVPMVLDGTGRKIPLPGATPNGTREESPPSASLCIGMTHREISLPPSALRNFARTYWINYMTDKAEHVRDDEPKTFDTFLVGTQYLQNSGSQTNIFYRSVAAFDRPRIGQATIFGGTVTFDVDKSRAGTFHNCVSVNTPAPPDWQSATWVPPTRPLLATAVQSGLTLSQPVDAWMRNWTSPSRATFLLSGTDYAEDVKSTVQGRNFSCYATATKLRLVVSTGVDQ